jgi:hypothetical protein
MSDPRPAKRVYVTIAEVRHELVPTSKLTFPETKVMKRVSEGMALVEIEQGIAKADPDAWFAWIYVSLRRKRPTLTVEELETAIGETPIVAVINSAEDEASEVADPDPPAQRLANGSDEQPSDNGSGEKTQPPSIPAIAGPPT